MLDGKFLFTAKKTFRRSISWSTLDAAGAVYGKRFIKINGNIYAIRLLTREDWNRVIQPLHQDGINPRLYNYTNTDIRIRDGNGGETWVSTFNANNEKASAVGMLGPSDSNLHDKSDSSSTLGWRPVLEFVGKESEV